MRVGNIVRPCPVVQVTDSVGKAAEAIRKSGCPILPVMQDGIVVGMVDEDALLSVSLNSHRELRVGDLMRPVISPISPDTPLSYAAWLMKSQGLSALPIVGMDGKLQGMVTRADVVSALLRGLRPSRIGGMATPFGVYLTTGNHRGGVGDFALITTGVVMAVCLILARVLVLAALYLTDTILRPIFGTSYGVGFFIPYLTGLGATPFPFVLDILPWVEILLFFTLMKLLPLTGYHGAEHQVVHAIEQGEDLTTEAVSRMPLEHPRCGTNLAALAILVSMALFSNISPAAKIALVFTAALFWRQLGMWLQRIFTVKKPKPRQLRSGLKAGEELLMRFQHQPFRPLPLIRQFWNMGFLQVLSGAWVVLWGANQIANTFGLPRFLF